MTLDQEKYFDEVFSTLRSKGWKSMMEDVTEKVDLLKEKILSYPVDPSASDFAKGRLAAYLEIANLESTMTFAYEMLKEDSEQDE